MSNDHPEMLQAAAVHLRKGDLLPAVQLYRQILVSDPDNREVLYRFGLMLERLGRWNDAAFCYRKITLLDDLNAQAHYGLANMLVKLAEKREAREHYERALQLQPENALAHNNFGNLLQEAGERDAALQHYRAAISLMPGYPDAHYNTGKILMELGHFEEAERRFLDALRYKPDLVNQDAHIGLAKLYALRHAYLSAEQHCYAALQCPGTPAEAYNVLGMVYKNQGRLQDARHCFAKAVSLPERFAVAHSNLLLTLHYLPEFDRRELFEEHLAWDRRQAAETLVPEYYPHSADEPARRLRIGYVSPDFRDHAVANFINSCIELHDKNAFAIYLYSDALRPDAFTERFKRSAVKWFDACCVPDAVLAERIADDGIDILVDLAGHTARNRLVMFAAKPAPIQLTWLGYPDTTGLAAMDYRITDACADPPGPEDEFYTEKLIRLPDSFLCYRPLQPMPAVQTLPAAKNGFVTFGSFNNLSKINPRVVGLWAMLLHAVAGARIMLKSGPLADQQVRERYLGMFARHGVGPERVELCGHAANALDHFELYGCIDIALDPFPYNGTTTTCEALWMGVPVVTLAGDRHSGRVGASLLGAVGLSDLIAASADEYVSKAAGLAGNIEGLQQMRRNLRDTVAASPLCDAERFTHNLETAYRGIWRARAEAQRTQNRSQAAGGTPEAYQSQIT